MKRHALIACILVALVLPCAFAAAQSFSDYATITSNNTAMLAEASAQGEIVSLLPVSSIVKVLGIKQSDGAVWYRIDDMNGSTGYIVSTNARLLTVDEIARLGLNGGGSGGSGSPTARRVELRGYTKARGYQHVSFGSYPTTKRGGEERIKWRVLWTDDDTALLLSDYILDCRPYIEKAYDDEPDRSCRFTSSDLYSFLNDDFYYTAFNSDERAALCDTPRGRVFVLDKRDFTNTAYGFSPGANVDDPNREAVSTAYAAAMGCYVSEKGGSNYWVGSPDDVYTGNMHYHGSIGRASSFRENIGVRVAVMVYLDLPEEAGLSIAGFDR